MKKNTFWAQILPTHQYWQLLFLICVGSWPMIFKRWKSDIICRGRGQTGWMVTRATDREQDQVVAAESSGREVPLVGRLGGRKAEPSTVGWTEKAHELVRNQSNGRRNKTTETIWRLRVIGCLRKGEALTLSVYFPLCCYTLLIRSSEKCKRGPWRQCSLRSKWRRQHFMVVKGLTLVSDGSRCRLPLYVLFLT